MSNSHADVTPHSGGARSHQSRSSFVVAGLDPAIHVLELARQQDVDDRDKRGHDEVGMKRHCLDDSI
jgi:hypothetical protein